MIHLKGTSDRVERLSFSPDGRQLLVPSWRGLQLWEEIREGGAPRLLSTYGWRSRFTPDGRRLLVGTTPFGVIDLDTGTTTSFELDTKGWVQFDLTPDGRAIVFLQHGQGQSHPPRIFRRSLDDLTTSVWSQPTSLQFGSEPFFLAGGDRFVLFQHSIDSRYLSAPVYVTRNSLTGEVIAEVRPKEDDLFRNAVQSANRRWLAGQRAGRIAVFRADDMSLTPATIRNDNRREFTGLAFHPSNQFLAATSNDNTVKFYDTTNWRMIHAFDWDIGRLRSIAFSPDGMLAAAGGDRGKIVVWDVDW